jgi:hypothetical protein
LITQEVLDNQVRLNLLTLTASSANLVSSTTLECTRYQAQFYLDEETLWLSCPPAQRYYIQAPEAGTEAETMTTQVYRLDPLQQFAVTGQWTLPQSRHLLLADENVVMLQTNSFYYYDYPIMPEPGIAFDVMPARPFEPVASEQCEIMRLGPEGSMTTLAKRDYCPSANQAALQSNQLVITQGFAGFEVMRW